MNKKGFNKIVIIVSIIISLIIILIGVFLLVIKKDNDNSDKNENNKIEDFTNREYKMGTKLKIVVDNDDIYTFYVIEDSGQDSKDVLVLLDRNLGDNVIWTDLEACDSDNMYPNIALDALKNRTSSWINANNLTYKLPISNKEISNVKARMLSKSDLIKIGYEIDSNPEVIYKTVLELSDNIAENSNGYWINDFDPIPGCVANTVLKNGGFGGSDPGNVNYGIRPVISISKEYINEIISSSSFTIKNYD